MMLLKKRCAQAQGLHVSTYAPIAKVFNDILADDRKRLRFKFDIAYFVASQKLAFTNYPAFCELEEKHGVVLGSAYTNQNAGKTFCHFIAESKRECLTQKLAKAQYFSILMDGSTDTGNIDDEVFLIQWCEVDTNCYIVNNYMVVIRVMCQWFYVMLVLYVSALVVC